MAKSTVANKIDDLLCQPTRLGIMASLMSLDLSEQVDFKYLKELLDLTDGNLGAHLSKLELAEYIVLEKTFVGKKPKAYISISDKGRRVFKSHVAALEEIIKPGKKKRSS